MNHHTSCTQSFTDKWYLLELLKIIPRLKKYLGSSRGRQTCKLKKKKGNTVFQVAYKHCGIQRVKIKELANVYGVRIKNGLMNMK